MATELEAERPALSRCSPEDLGSTLEISQSVYRPTQPLPPLSTRSAQSSLQSLSEDESAPPPKCSPKSNRKASLCLPRGSAEILNNPALPRRRSECKQLLFPPTEQTEMRRSRPLSNTGTSAAGILDAGASSRTEQLETLPRGLSTPAAQMEGRSSKDVDEADVLSENIQQLIREADLAFKTVGAAIADLDALSSGTATPKETPSKSTMSGRPSITKDGKSQFALRPHSMATGSPLKSPTRAASVSKVKRTKSKKSKKAKTNSASLADRVSRWTLSENVTEMLKGSFLRKIEADEMLTPERLEVVRASREYQLRQNVSRETLLTASTDDGSETPVDAFHLQDLPARIGSSGVNTSSSPDPQITQTLPLPELDRPIRRDFSFPRKPTPATASPSKKSSSDTRKDARVDEPPPLNPPPRSPGRSAVKSAQLSSPLPTIPEILVPKARKVVDKPKHRFAPVEDDESIFFYSTPYSLNMPTFRHGRIRFPKSDVMRGMNILPDDTMDWTAFQMAIGGGAGDIFSGSSDFTRRADDEGLDDLVSWFDEFGFESAGALQVAPSTPVGSTRRKRSRGESGEFSSASSSATDPDMELPIPVAQEFPHGFWNDGSVDTSKFTKDDGQCRIKRWTLDGPPKKRAGNRDSTGSLPQSPMMQLVFVGQGDDGEFVPMGYNLGHDLGDFLKWETQHALAFGQE